MPKITLSFELPEERAQFERACAARRLYAAASDFLEWANGLNHDRGVTTFEVVRAANHYLATATEAVDSAVSEN